MSENLKGKTFVVTDNILVLGRGSVAFGDMLEDFQSPLQATVIDRLQDEGAKLLEESADELAGVVAGGKAAFGVEADSDGSVRMAAAQNGLFGYKPTYGMVSRYGIIAMASSMDAVSLVAGSVKQIEQISEIISGPDGRDSMVFEKNFKNEARDQRNEARRVGLVKEFVTDKLVLERAEEVSMSMAKYVLPIYQTILSAEVSSNFMQYDGVRYGKRGGAASRQSAGLSELDKIYHFSRGEGFNRKTKINIMVGFHVLSSAMFDAYFMQAAKARTMLIDEFDKLFGEHDFLVGSADSETMAMAAALAGLPAVSLPNGMQIIAPMKNDAKLLEFARGIK